jgi:hypothetical protein
MFGVTSGLGSSACICGHCGGIFISKRREWADMNVFRRLWYIVVSLIYISFVAGLGAYAISELFEACTRQSITEADFFVIVLLLAVLLGGFQCVRVLWSRQRSEAREPSQVVASFWSVHTNFALLCVLGLLGLQAIAGLVHFLVAVH